jgi:hypothetical protein
VHVGVITLTSSFLVVSSAGVRWVELERVRVGMWVADLQQSGSGVFASRDHFVLVSVAAELLRHLLVKLDLVASVSILGGLDGWLASTELVLDGHSSIVVRLPPLLAQSPTLTLHAGSLSLNVGLMSRGP